MARRLASACHGYVVGRLSYPGYVCISLNDEIVHGIGSADRIVRDGDLVSLDVVVRRDGFIGDNARTILVGAVDPRPAALRRHREVASGRHRRRPGRQQGRGIFRRHPGGLDPGGYGIVRDFVGHGVGRKMHEEPQIPNYGKAGTGPRSTIAWHGFSH
jgi:methionyl aminopeptidase